MKDTELDTLYGQLRVIQGKDRQEAIEREEEEALLFKRILKLACICEGDLVKPPKKKLFGKAKCPRCSTTLTCSEIFSSDSPGLFGIRYFTCGSCDYEYAKDQRLVD